MTPLFGPDPLRTQIIKWLRSRMDISYVIDASGEGQGPIGALVPWWSFTKTLIAVACLRAAEVGLLQLDDPAVPEGYTFRQLLRHEAGLPDYGSWPDYHEAVSSTQEPWPLAAIVRRGVINASPSGHWAYSNIGYAIAAAALAKKTRLDLGQLLASYVLVPAGAVSARLVTRRRDIEGIRGIAPGYHPGWVYHGLVIGEVRDAARVVWALLAEKLIGRVSLDALLRLTPLPQFQRAPWEGASYGLGVMTPQLQDEFGSSATQAEDRAAKLRSMGWARPEALSLQLCLAMSRVRT